MCTCINACICLYPFLLHVGLQRPWEMRFIKKNVLLLFFAWSAPHMHYTRETLGSKAMPSFISENSPTYHLIFLPSPSLSVSSVVLHSLIFILSSVHLHRVMMAWIMVYFRMFHTSYRRVIISGEWRMKGREAEARLCYHGNIKRYRGTESKSSTFWRDITIKWMNFMYILFKFVI